ncbi:S41 family peptidase [Tautonia marina]|uniref:S41 family peptidase n=1 Tax=Tautonia marina TaxID=2653855 RepID=UPI00126124AF|nr:S41 family peptidase [Tautonia marina]
MLALLRGPLTGLFILALAFLPASPMAANSAVETEGVGSIVRQSIPRSEASSTVEPRTPEDALTEALERERARDWSGAMDLYEQALERWPSRTDFRHRLRLCQTHYRLGRRYEDRSFRSVLLRLPRSDVMALYEELLERIEIGYVDPVRFEPLLRHGYDNLEVALRDPVFLEAHRIDASERADRVRWLRDAYRSQRAKLSVQSRGDANAQVESACDLGQRALGLPEAAIALEFVYGACDALDDYTGCLTPDKLSDLYAEIDGNFVGIGVELKRSERGLLLVNVIRDGPAWEAGLKPGEQIVVVDGQPLDGLSLDAAAGMLQGVENSGFAVEVLGRDGQTRTVDLVRRPVEVWSVESSALLPGGIGFIRLISFQKTTLAEMDRAVADLQAKGMHHLVLDLRGNPGGLLNVAVELADRFLDRGRIVATRGRAPGQTFDYLASQATPWQMPVTLLVDGDSASASEILAGALKEHRRAVVIGERTFGKGSVQSIYPLRAADAALKLTTAKFYSPNDRPYSEYGVSPDIEVASSARPASDRSEEAIEPIPFGDPERDPALRIAIRRVQAEDLAGNAR